MDKTIEIARAALRKLTLAGADSAQCRIDIAQRDEIQAEAKRFNLMRSYATTDLTLSAVLNKRAATVRVNRADERSVDAAVTSCIDAAKLAPEDACAGFADKAQKESFKRGVFEADLNAFIGRLVEFAGEMDRAYPQVMYECGGTYQRERTALVNTNGVEMMDERGYYSVYTGFMAIRGTQTTSFGPGASYITLNPDERVLDRGDMRGQIEAALSLLDPRPIGRKFIGSLLAAPAFTRFFFGTLAQIALSDSPLTSGTGRLCGKLGEQVASDCLTLSFAPHSEDILMGERFTADGYLSADCSPIQHGRLTEYLLSRHGALTSGLRRGANLGTALLVQAGKPTLEEMIARVEHGLLIGRYSGAAADVAGEISGVAKNSFLIENGKIVCPVVETMISANLFDMLQNVRAVSCDAERNGRTVAPYMAFDGITIQ